MRGAQKTPHRTNLPCSIAFTWLTFPDNWQPSAGYRCRPDLSESVDQIIDRKNESQWKMMLLWIYFDVHAESCSIWWETSFGYQCQFPHKHIDCGSWNCCLHAEKTSFRAAVYRLFIWRSPSPAKHQNSGGPSKSLRRLRLSVTVVIGASGRALYCIQRMSGTGERKLCHFQSAALCSPCCGIVVFSNVNILTPAHSAHHLQQTGNSERCAAIPSTRSRHDCLQQSLPGILWVTLFVSRAALCCRWVCRSQSQHSLGKRQQIHPGPAASHCRTHTKISLSHSRQWGWLARTCRSLDWG